MKTKSKLDTRIENTRILLKNLVERREKQLSTKVIKCASCEKSNKIKDIELVGVETYVQPYSCTGGDYWQHSEYNYICPHCQVRNRFLFNDYYNINYQHRQQHNLGNYFFTEYRDRFKSFKRKADNEMSNQFVNNYYIEKNIDKFLTEKRIKELDKYRDRPYA